MKFYYSIIVFLDSYNPYASSTVVTQSEPFFIDQSFKSEITNVRATGVLKIPHL